MNVLTVQGTALPFVGKIIIPARVTEDVCIFYKGVRLPVHKQEHNGSTIFTYELLEDKKAQTISFLVCPSIDFKTQLNTVEYLKLNESIPYLFLELTGTRSYNTSGGLAQYSWHAQEKEITVDTDFKVPDDAVIFFFAPEYVQFKIKTWSQDMNTRVLPDCVISQSAPQAVIDKELIKAHFAAADVKTVHASMNNGQKKQFGRIIATMMSA